MKKILIVFLALNGSFGLLAQNAPVVEKAAPKSNNTLPSGGTLGANSGVNPMGNPGTIANSSATSSAVNNTVAPHPNVEPGTFLSSSPQGTVTGTIGNGNGKTQLTTTVTPSGTVTGVVNTASEPAVTKTPVVTNSTSKKTPAIKASSEPTPKNNPVTVKNKEKEIPAYHPVLGNYVSEKTVTKIKNKYGGSVYDIRTIRIASTNQLAYIVRLLEDGKLRNELFFDEQ